MLLHPSPPRGHHEPPEKISSLEHILASTLLSPLFSKRILAFISLPFFRMSLWLKQITFYYRNIMRTFTNVAF